MSVTEDTSCDCDQPLIYSVTEAAKKLGVSHELVRQWLERCCCGHARDLHGEGQQGEPCAVDGCACERLHTVLPEVARVSNRRLIPRKAVDALVDVALEGWDPAVAGTCISGQELRSVS